MKTIRTYVAGLGSGGALLAAVVIGFVGLGAIVAFDGLPSTSASSDDATVIAESSAPETAAVAAAAPASAPAAAPTAPAAAGVPGAPGGGGTGGGGSAGGPDGAPGAGPPEPPGTPPPTEPTQPGGPAPAPADPAGAVTGVIDAVDGTVEGTTGVDPDLGGKTGPITDILDEAVKELPGGRGLGLEKAELPGLQP